MRSKLSSAVFVALSLLALSAPTFAHHGGAAYDNGHPMTLTGTVVEFHFIQPHPLIALDVKDDKGTVTQWSVEMTAPNHLIRYGWNSRKLKAGDQITVTGNPAKNGFKVLNLNKISWANGEAIPLGAPRDDAY